MSAPADHSAPAHPTPASLEGDINDDRESGFSGVWLIDVLTFLERTLGEQGVGAVLQAAGEQRPLSVLRDPATWSSFEQVRAVMRSAGEALGGPDALVGAGDIMVDDDRPGGYVDSMQALASPSAVFAAVADVGPNIAPAYRVVTEQVGETEWIVRERLREGLEAFPELCAMKLGEYRTFPRLFGFTEVHAVEERCQARGDQECVFRVRWEINDERERRAAVERLRARVLEARMTRMHELVGDLASEDTEASLHRIVATFTEALLAPIGLLVSDDPHTGERSIYATGIDDAEAHEMAGLIEAGGFDGATLHVVEVASVRARHGYLAAVGSGVPAHRTQDILGLHARVAATALDLITALAEARRQARSAESMAELSTALAEIASPGETASKLARMTPPIVDCEQALVFLPEIAGGKPLLSAAQGVDDATLAIVRANLFGRAITDDITARGRIDDCLSESGVDAIIEPIGSGADPIGWICVGSGRGGRMWRREARVRLRGVAAQAATAISNAHLLDQVRHQALHDGLTGLPNRTLIQDRLEQMLARARRVNVPVAVLFLDLDGFKDINDTFGHDAGDEVLRAVASRLTAALRESDVVGRLGGDEFVVLSEGAVHDHDPDLIARRVISVMREPFDIAAAREHGNGIVVSASVGSTRGDRQTPGELLRDADLALYEAKRSGKNRHVRFASEMQSAARSQALLERDLRGALEQDRFAIVYQPIFDLGDQHVLGAEALLRWEDPERGTVLPDEFIPTLEANGSIVEVGRWVLRRACEQAAAWRKDGHDVSMSVNVSPRQLDEDEFVDDVRAALDDAQLDAGALILEITESAIMRDPATAVARLQALKDLGVRLAIDDFGTGYSSLAYLQQFPVDAIKIDRSFVAGMTESAESGAIVRALVDLGRTLGLETLAEGIEEHDQRRSLEQAHCDSGQGYLFARPLPASAIDEMLAANAAARLAPPQAG